LGLHRWQGRNPSRSASLGVEKNSVFFRNGRRAGQLGRQYICVDVTPKKNAPSARASLARVACQ
jgi:hypothetical protein